MGAVHATSNSSSKESQAEELLEWLAGANDCAKLPTLDVRGLTRASFPAIAHFLPALPVLEHLRLAFLEDIGADGASCLLPNPNPTRETRR
ncbi:hypothetical protein FIBSPDRAFT_866574 [Athelia psychrophila]|uniref:Uncharacterized protein n=1 Tax=Athelia psychrophila TaxID=1759441 RepID=A0A166ERY7_9AGAM|nr:hypothetical protein FIBSPDRAFT_866574 [Fibularhizoctonia sp. CBS 109695]